MKVAEAPRGVANRGSCQRLDILAIVGEHLNLGRINSMNLGESIWTLLVIFLMIMFFMIFFMVVLDLFSDHEESGLAKAVWIIFLIKSSVQASLGDLTGGLTHSF